MNDPAVLTVAELTRQVKGLIEANFSYVWVQGEVSNCTRAASGHIYLTLKDESAQIRAVIWRRTASRLRFDLQDGLEVVAAGPVELYQARGTFQLIVEELIPQGVGALELAFRQMQAKLEAEGLFAPERKRPLPRFPRRIALVTSPTGAAVRDMLQVITRRWPVCDLVILPVPVQGEGAAAQIAGAIRMAEQLPGVDVVVAGRGGGSLEDLWAFNEEVVARAIFDCRVPVVSAVGHEIDVSISDLVADCRALTPSEAGELLVPLKSEVLNEFGRLRDRLAASLRGQAVRGRMELEALSTRRVLDRPLERIHDLVAVLDEWAEKLRRSAKRGVEQTRHRLAETAGSLDALSPLKVLSRGYSITRRADDGDVLRAVDQVQPGEHILSVLRDGQILSRVESIENRATFPPTDSTNSSSGR